jgi:hypothetical protein
MPHPVSPKIYKGENYRLLPYVMLDHPRIFRGKDAFSIRSFFWWGQHFSIHLVLGGKYKAAYENKVMNALRSAKLPGWNVAFTNDPWEHHFGRDNYSPAEDFDITGIHANSNYLKLGQPLPLNMWNEAESFFINAVTQLASIIF